MTLFQKFKIGNLIEKRLMDYVETLQNFVRQPSVSTEGTGIHAMANMVSEEMAEVGFESHVLESAPDGYPVVLGVLSNNKNDKTLLVYGHYDVHPVGNPIDWKVDPFSAELVEDRIIGRGTADNKGNFLSWIKAVQLFREIGFELPLNLILLIEGEEEIGSPHLGEFVRRHRDLLSKANAKVVFEPRQDARGKSFINLGWKGSLCLKLTFESKSGQIHSSYASIVSNPIWQLMEALISITDGTNVTIPGFYNRVAKKSEEEKNLVAQIEWDKDDLISVLALTNESFKDPHLKGQPLRERLLLEPGFNISAITAGSVEPAVNAVIPEKASCLIEFRLVPQQRCTDIIDLVKRHLQKLNHKIQVDVLSKVEASRTSPKEKVVQAIKRSCELTFGVAPDIYPSLQGISPDYLFTDLLGVPSVGGGCGYHHLCHRPNEFITLLQFSKAIELSANIIDQYGNKEFYPEL